MSIRHHKTTDEWIEKKKKNGDGQGDGADYRPWIRVGDFGSKGRMHRVAGADARIHHFMSDLERDYYYWLLWNDDIVDIKEQYPLNLDETEKIAEELGIRHPSDPATKHPIVMTTDFLISEARNSDDRQVARAVKYSKDLEGKRIREKLEIEKRYWNNRGVKWGIVTEKSFSRTTSKNIMFLMDYYNSAEDDMESEILLDFAEKLLDGKNARIGDICAAVDAEIGLRTGETLKCFYYLASHKVIPVNIGVRWQDWTVREIVNRELLEKYWKKGVYDGNLDGRKMLV